VAVEGQVFSLQNFVVIKERIFCPRLQCFKTFNSARPKRASVLPCEAMHKRAQSIAGWGKTKKLEATEPSVLF
jgi:hypothetical protein